MPSTMPQLSLSPVYRHAQRALGAWLDQDAACARRHAMRVRAALPALDVLERHRFLRWLAWLCLAAEHRGADLGNRIRRLDAALYRSVATVLATLPPSMRPLVSAAASRIRFA